MKTIKKFCQIKIIPNSLVILDIDDTLIKFEGVNYIWWKNKYNKYYKIHQKHETAEELANEDWKKIVSKTEPKLVDEEIYEFIDELIKNNCYITLLTARNIKFKDLTLEHLAKVNLDLYQVYFNSNKGDELYKISHKNYFHLNNIIVVDDVMHNLENIQLKMKDSKFNIHLYNIK